MTFRRTSSGLSNLYLFLGVDAVVFLEGGRRSYTREDVNSGLCSKSSSDIRFWQTLFLIYRPEKKYQFRSIGSKETVKSIAIDIEAGKISRVVVAMDRDFDHINNKIIATKNVVYTKGYSWENDAWNKITMIEAYCSFSGSCKSSILNEMETIDRRMNAFIESMRDAINMDAVLSQYGDSVFDRNKPIRYVLIDRNGLPSVNESQVNKSLSEAMTRNKTLITNNSVRHSIDELLDCFGHLIAEYSYRLLAYLVEKVQKLPRMPKEYAAGMIVAKFGKALGSGILTETKRHYDIEFSRVNI